jgi:hypothetical protein
MAATADTRMTGMHSLLANRAADAAEGRGSEIVPGYEPGTKVLTFRSDPFTTLSVNSGMGTPRVTLETSLGKVELPSHLAAGIARKITEHRADAIEDARANFEKVVTDIKGHIKAVFSNDPEKRNRYGVVNNNHNQGYAEVPGVGSNVGAVEYIQASKNTNGTGSIVEGFVAGVSFSIRPGWNPETKRMGIVLTAERYVARDASFRKEIHGADAEAVFNLVRDEFKAHRKIGTTLEAPKAR